MLRAVACIVLVLLTTAARADPSVSFDTAGGDAWSVRLDIAGQASPDCDKVTIESPLGATLAHRSGDRFHARLVLRNGENRIEAVCSKRDRILARSQPQLWRLRLPDEPKAWIRVRALDGSVLLDAGASETATAQPAPLVKFEWRARAGNPAPLKLADGRSLQTQESIAGERLELALPERDGEYYVTLDIADADGRVDRSTAVFRVREGAAEEVDLRSEHPAWLDGAVVYGAAPYFFQPATFRGVAARVDAIAALGATVLWLSPVTAAAPGDFGYAVADQFQLREQFGGEQEFRALVAAAHRAGLRVLVDFVPNHLSVDSAYFGHMTSNGARSPYYRWFDRDTAGEITHYFDWQHLANLDFDNAQVRAYVTAAMRRLVRDFDVDGFRVDASWAVARRAPEFWPQLRAELKRVDPDIVLLAEASAREPYNFANGFDAAYDWTSRLGEWSWRAAFPQTGRLQLDELRAALAYEGASPVRDALILRFLNNNDTGSRFITRFGLPLTKVAATLLFTLPGIPLIYNGDEAGAAFEPYDEGPPIVWNDGGELALHYRELTALRRNKAALRSSMLQLLRTDADEKVLAYLRPAASGADDVLVLLNFSAEPLSVRAADAATRATFKRFRRARVRLAPYGTLVLSTG
ncbi:MAG TPA: alpha-amylase family glycosyl hydrolase [Steroidobacteraceae bacterium]|nr:alpha-amylase family glycosyl hydrolase [Steroidobacteraceae bacterium]